MINDRLMIDLYIWSCFSHIVHQPAVVSRVLEGVLRGVLGVDLVVRRVLVVRFDFLQSPRDDILDLILFLIVCQGRLYFNSLLLGVFEHVPNLIFGFPLLGIQLHRADVGVIGNLVHLLQDAIHQRVETFHDVESLLKVLYLAETALDLLEPRRSVSDL